MAKVNHLKAEDLQEWANKIAGDGTKVYIVHNEKYKTTKLILENDKEIVIFPMVPGRKVSKDCSKNIAINGE